MRALPSPHIGFSPGVSLADLHATARKKVTA
jgi:hypothetical protein